MATVTESLVEVQFYTALDPYYYMVDNRPLQNLDTNIKMIAAASDAAAGGSNRASLAAASAGYSLIGFGDLVAGDAYRQAQGMYSGSYDISGLEMAFGHGFMISPKGTPGSTYVEPLMGVHDKVTTIIPQTGRGCTVQAKLRATTDSDRISSAGSPIQVAEISIKQGTAPGDFPLPDAGAIAILKINVPSGVSSITPAYIERVNMKQVAQTADVLDNAKIGFNTYSTTLSSGQQNIGLSGSTIDREKMNAVEVFVQGVNQFNWTHNAGTHQITLATPLTASADVVVRQTKISL